MSLRRAVALLAFLLATLMPQLALATEVPVFEELLDDGDANTSGYLGSIGAGSFVADGWMTTTESSQLRYDIDKKNEFLNGLSCGSMELEFGTFDPNTNYHGGTCGMCPDNTSITCDDPQCTTASSCNECYVIISSAYQTDQGNMKTAIANDEVAVLTSSIHSPDPGDVNRNETLKFEALGAPNTYLPSLGTNPQDWTSLASQGAVFISKHSWSCSGVTHSLQRVVNATTTTWSWNHAWNTSGTQPRINYVFVGKDNTKSLWLGNVTYRRVKVSVDTPCDCDAIGPKDGGPADAAGQDAAPADAAADAGPDAHGGGDAASTVDAPSAPAGGSCACQEGLRCPGKSSAGWLIAGMIGLAAWRRRSSSSRQRTWATKSPPRSPQHPDVSQKWFAARSNS